jgi:hypothetical protein
MSCSFDPCTRKAYAKDLCQSHYKMSLREEPLRPLRPREGARLKICTFDNCEKPHKGNNYCSGHNYQMKKYGKVWPIKYNTPGEWGEWYVNGSGYVMRTKTINKKRISQLQHRAVIEEALGRELLPEENVHHINGIRADNRIENLELWVSSQPSGQRVEDLLHWAKEIIKRYEK